MPIDVVCDSCFKAYRVADDRAGRKVRCGCGASFAIPKPEGSALAELGELETAAASTAAEPVSRITFDVEGDEEEAVREARAARRHRPPTPDIPIDEHMRLGKEDMREKEFEKAAGHFAYVAQRTLHPEAPGLLQDALKLQLPSVYFFRTIGLKAPWASGSGISKFYLIGGFVIAGAANTIRKLSKNDPQFERMGLWLLAGLAAMVCLGRIVDYAATFRIRNLRYGYAAFSKGDGVGAIIGIVMMVVAAAFAGLFAARVSGTMAAVGALAFASAGGIYLICRTPTNLGRALMAGIYLTLLTVGIIGVAKVAAVTTPGNLSQRVPTVPGIMFLVSFVGILAMRPMQTIIIEFCGSRPDLLDQSTLASRAGKLRVSKSKLRKLHPELYGIRSLFFRITHAGYEVSAKDAQSVVEQSLQLGDAQPAMVVTVDPLVVAAYSEDLDEVILLEFPASVAKEMTLTKGSRLVSINSYGPMSEREDAPDVEFGPETTGQWGNFHPHVANFLSDDMERISGLEKAMKPKEWERLKVRLAERLRRSHKPRMGNPLHCHVARSIFDGDEPEVDRK